jgi:hypothetical protein
MHQILPKGSTQRSHDGNTSNVQNPFVIDQWRDRPPHTPLAPAFASLHLRTPMKQTAHQRSTSAPSIPHFHERIRPSLETIDIDENEEETSDVGEDPMDVLNRCEKEIWENSRFQNHQLRLKIRKVAHKQTRMVLVVLRRKAEIGSDNYPEMYTKVFKALVTKQIASGKTDSHASTLSITNWEDHTECDEDMIQLELKREPEEAQVPQPSHRPSSVSFADPLIADAVAQMYAPQQQGESVGEYHRHRDATIRLHNLVLEGTPIHHNTNQPALTEDSESAHPAARGTSKVPTPAMQARCEVRVPMADK